MGRSDRTPTFFRKLIFRSSTRRPKTPDATRASGAEGDTFLVEDLDSVNGTVINDAIRLGPRQPRALENGDKIRLGETTLHFLVG